MLATRCPLMVCRIPWSCTNWMILIYPEGSAKQPSTTEPVYLSYRRIGNPVISSAIGIATYCHQIGYPQIPFTGFEGTQLRVFLSPPSAMVVHLSSHSSHSLEASRADLKGPMLEAPISRGRGGPMDQWNPMDHQRSHSQPPHSACGRIPFNLHGWNEHSGHTCGRTSKSIHLWSMAKHHLPLNSFFVQRILARCPI